MEQRFLKKEGRPSLLLIFGGWGSWPGLFSGYAFPQESDVMFCFDYRTMDFDPSPVRGYGNVRLVAWSMGVWAAAHVLSGPGVREGLRLEGSIAVNGTMSPVDDLQGIPVRIFEGTLERMSRPVLDKFIRRMCGRNLQEYLSRGPERTPEELRDELAVLYSAVKGSASPDFRWDAALIGIEDMIFPAENQRRAWAGIRTVEMPAPHYGKELFEYAIGTGWLTRD